nr:hypothetical protein [Klebsiella pneumoniae]
MCGVIGNLLPDPDEPVRIPPCAGGGYRSCCPRLPAGWKYSPRMRGLSEVFDLIQKGTDVFPPHAELSGTLTDTFCTVLVFPPCAGVIGYQWGKSSFVNVFPRMRGVIGTSVENPLWRIPLPACGVIGENGNLHKNVFCIPPVCGGYYRPRLSKAK